MATNMIIGPPGTGKTTQLAKMVAEDVERGRKPLVCSLTRAAAKEIGSRKIPVHQDRIGTLHSLAYRALGQPPVVESQLQQWNDRGNGYHLSRGAGDMDDFCGFGSQKTTGDRLEQKYHYFRARMFERDVWPRHVQAFAHEWEQWKKEDGLVDYTDMIEQARDCYPPEACDILYADEAQDHCKLELELLRAWAMRAGNLTIIGDGDQALYEWRGAHPKMFNMKTEGSRSVLAQSYRVPRAVHRAAISWLKGLSDYRPVEYYPRDLEGRAERLEGVHWKAPDIMFELVNRRLEEGKSVMILGSCAYMLGPTLAILRQEGMPFCNPWRRKRGDWNPLGGSKGKTFSDRILAFLRPLLKNDAADSFNFGVNENKPQRWTLDDIGSWIALLVAKDLLYRGSKKEIQERVKLGDDSCHTPIIPPLIDHWFEPGAAVFLTAMMEGQVKIEDALRFVESRLLGTKQKVSKYPIKVIRSQGVAAIQTEPKLYIGTGHSFKGAEADTVIIFPDLSIPGYESWCGQGEDGCTRDSVIRLFYVALTRAREEAYVCNPYSMLNCSVRDVV